MNVKRSFFVLFLVVATELIGFGLIIPVLPQLALQFQVSPLLIGVLMAAYSAAQFFSAPLLGSLSDRYGRKPLLIISKMGTVLAYVVMAVSQSYGLFLVARLLDGFTGGNISVARAYVTDITTPENRPKGMAIIGISFGVGFILGPALGGLLYGDDFSYAVPALVAGGLSLLALLLTVLLLEEPHEKQTSNAGFKKLFSGFYALSQPNIRNVCLVYFLYMLVFSGFEATFSVFSFQSFGYSVKQNSWLFMYAGLLSLLVQGGVARRSFKNVQGVTVLGLILAGISFLLLGGSMRLLHILFAFVFLALGIGLVNSFLPALLSLFVSDEDRGAVMGMYEGIGSLSRIIGPIVAYMWILQAPRLGYVSFCVVLVLLAFILKVSIKNR